MSSSISNPLSSLSSTLGNATSSISSISSGISSALQGKVNDAFNSKYIYIGLVVVIVVCVLLAWTLYYIISSRIFALSKVVADDTASPVICSSKRKFNFEFERSLNGERRSFTFWIYIHDLNVGRSLYKNVFSVNETKDPDSIGKASPYIFLDGTNNRLFIRFAKASSTYDETLNYKYSDLSDNTKLNKFMSTGIVIPYVPLQRWVHISIVANANSYKNYIYAYVDGDLVNTTSTGEADKLSTLKQVSKDLKNLNLNVNGYLLVGGNATDLVDGPGFAGLVAKVTTYNYELNQQDIYDDYYNGPVGGVLATLGLSNYGLRSPIYKIS